MSLMFKKVSSQSFDVWSLVVMFQQQRPCSAGGEEKGGKKQEKPGTVNTTRHQEREVSHTKTSLKENRRDGAYCTEQ